MHLIYWGDILVGLHSCLSLMSGTTKYGYRSHRVVILPDYQGLGIGTKVVNFFGQYYLERGYKYFLKTTHARLGRHMDSNENWKPTTENKRPRGEARTKYDNDKDLKYNPQYFNKENRLAYSYEYVGKDYNSIEHQIIVAINDEPYEIVESYLKDIIKEGKLPIIITGIASLDEVNNFELYAKNNGIRTEVLFVKSHGEYNINKSKLSTKFDCIATTKEAQDQISQYKANIQSMITYDFRVSPPKLWKRIKN